VHSTYSLGKQSRVDARPEDLYDEGPLGCHRKSSTDYRCRSRIGARDRRRRSRKQARPSFSQDSIKGSPIHHCFYGEIIPDPCIIVFGKLGTGVEALSMPGSVKVIIELMK
jgi:hypothetical protein